MRDCKDCRLTVVSAPATAPPQGDVDVIIDPCTFFGLGLGDGGPSGPPIGTPDAVVDPGNFYSLDSVGTCLLTYRLLLTSEVYEPLLLTSEVYELPPPEPVVYEVSVEPEPIGVVASLVSGMFRNARQELEVEPERMGITATLIAANFHTSKIELSVEPESMAVDATFVEGSLVQSPVYRAPALSVSISMNITGGSHD